jgi:metallo-beta-lactamase class B
MRRIALAILLLCAATSSFASPDIKPMPPFRIADNLYFVGNTFDASYLVVTKKGNILINTSDPEHLQLIKDSIKQLGLHYNDIKIIIASHAHIDHCGAAAIVKSETHAKYLVTEQDVRDVESGGKTDSVYGSDPAMNFPITKVDNVLHDGDLIKLGSAVITTHLTPGHTKGAVTWTLSVTDKGKTYNAVITGSTSVNPGYVLVNNKDYPNIANDYAQTFRILKSLPCDIFLGAHGSFFEIDKKYDLIGKSDVNPFVDPDGYQKFILQQEEKFDAELKKQSQ